MRPIAVITASALVTGAFLLVSCGSGARCDDPSTVETVKSLLDKRFADYGTMTYLLRDNSDVLARVISHAVTLPLSAFRERGKIGNGIVCAALITVTGADQKALAEISTEYSVEPTNDGKVMVSARFGRN